MRRHSYSFLPLVIALIASPAGAQAINGAATGLSAPAATYTFEGKTAGAQAGSEYAGITFSTNLYNDGNSYFAAVGGGRSSLANFANNACPCVSPSDIFFTSAVNGAAFMYFTNPGVSTFTALLNNTVVYSFADNVDLSGRTTPTWYGFDSSIAFDQINIVSGGSNTAFVLDNLEVGKAAVVTPEPASLVLLATGLFGVAGVVRRRRK